MIEFNKPPYEETAIEYIKKAIENNHICGDGIYTQKCTEWIEKKTKTKKCLYTTSCTHALEMSALLIDIKPGDEVIMPSYTFASTADAFVLRGAKIVFVDIRPDTMNIDENLIENAITKKTRVIVVVHYAGIACEMDIIMGVAKKYGLYVVEDAAQGVMASYKGHALGSIGDFGCFSFHETKNYSMGEGGAILLNDKKYIEKAEILREKGTNRSKFWRGEIDKYTWVGLGSSYLPSELNMAYLWAQLEKAEEINNKRIELWNKYNQELLPLQEKEKIELLRIPEECCINAHMYCIKTRNIENRTNLIQFLKDNGIRAVFHYVPLHLTPSGKKYGKFYGADKYTTKESERVLRLPLHQGLNISDVDKVVSVIYRFYENR